MVNFKMDESQLDKYQAGDNPKLFHHEKGHIFKIEGYSWKSWAPDSTNYAYLFDSLINRIIRDVHPADDSLDSIDLDLTEELFRKEYQKVKLIMQKVKKNEKFLGEKLLYFIEEHKKVLNDTNLDNDQEFVKKFHENMLTILEIGKKLI